MEFHAGALGQGGGPSDSGDGVSPVNSAGSFCSDAARDDVQSFFTAHPVPAAETELKHAIERINGCIEMRRLQEPGLKKWLAERAKP